MSRATRNYGGSEYRVGRSHRTVAEERGDLKIVDRGTYILDKGPRISASFKFLNRNLK